MTVHEVAQGGVRRDVLVAQRDKLAQAMDAVDIDSGDPKQIALLATLSRELREVHREIDALGEMKGGSLLDELTAKRAEREAAAASADAAKVRQ